MTAFRWGRFSQFVEAGIVSADHLLTGEAQGIHLSTKPMSAAEGQGRLEYLHAPDFRAIIANCTFHDAKRYEMVDDGLVRFHFGSDVSIRAWAGEKLLHDIADNPAGLLVAAPDKILVEQVPAEERQRFVTVACRPEWLEKAFGVRLSKHVGYEVDLSAAAACHYPIRYDGDLRRIVGEMIDPRVPEQLKPAFFAAKTQEILVYALSAIMKSGEGDAYRLTERDLAAVREAHEILQDALVAAPDLNTLSRRVGINRTKLSYGFRHLYGMSVSQFVASRRLEHACQLLVQTDMTISQIAVAIGYEHACNFSTSFKSQFGCSPREYRTGERGGMR